MIIVLGMTCRGGLNGQGLKVRVAYLNGGGLGYIWAFRADGARISSRRL
jgi:hypothetical protein